MRALACLLFAIALPAAAEQASAPDALADKQEHFGAVVAPAALPGGSAAAYAFVGAPELGGGYRQGFSGFELEGRASFNFFMLSAAVEAIAKLPVLHDGSFELAPQLGFGLVYDSGSRYFDVSNFQHFGLRPRAGAVATFRVADTVRAIAALDVPWDISTSPPGAYHVKALVGGGAEIYLGEDISGLLLGQIGPDIIKEPQGVPQVRLGYQLRLGVGFRLF